MNKREAKRLACSTAAAVLDSEWGQGAGWAWSDKDGEELSPADLGRYNDALNELIDELERRGTR